MALWALGFNLLPKLRHSDPARRERVPRAYADVLLTQFGSDADRLAAAATTARARHPDRVAAGFTSDHLTADLAGAAFADRAVAHCGPLASLMIRQARYDFGRACYCDRAICFVEWADLSWPPLIGDVEEYREDVWRRGIRA